MFYCKSFQKCSRRIQDVWDGRLNQTIGNWKVFTWWISTVGYALFVVFIFFAFTDEASPLGIRYYLQQVYCPAVGDCVPFWGGWLLPAWYEGLLFLWGLFLISGLMTRQAYQQKQWCKAWWAYLVYTFSVLYLTTLLAAGIAFIGGAGSPHFTALLGYGLPLIYTIWFTSVLLPFMRPLWRGERIAFRPPSLKLRAGAGSMVALLGIVGVALGRIFGEMPQGKWGYLIMGIIGTPWLMYLLISSGVRSLVTLAPWRIVLEAEAREQGGGEGQ